VYTAPFAVEEGTTVNAVIKQGGKVLLTMSETFGKNEGLFWGDENSKDMWKGRGVNISAEDALLEGAARASAEAHHYKGTGFVQFDEKEGSITWYKENDGEGMEYAIRFRYMHNDEHNRYPMKLYVNDEYVKGMMM